MHNGNKRVCLLTGASGTLGTTFCRLHADKYQIAAVYRREPPRVPSQYLQLVDPLDLQTELPENAHPVFALQASLTDDRELARVVEVVLARFERIDVLINAAGQYTNIPMTDSDRFLTSLLPTFEINVCVPMKLAVLVAKNFWRGREEENARLNRNIINLSSTAGLRIYPNVGQGIYSASKAALNYLTCHMASEMHFLGLRVNTLAPNSFPQIVSTEQVVQSLLLLDEGKMSGQVLVCDADNSAYAAGTTGSNTRQTDA